MPGIYQLSMDNLGAEMDEVVSLGIKSVILFGVPLIMIKTNREQGHFITTDLCKKQRGLLKNNILKLLS